MASRLPRPSVLNAESIRMNAVTALGWLETNALSAAPDLAVALSDEYHFVRFSSAQLLKTFGPSARATLPTLLLSLQSTNAAIADNVIGVVVSVGRDQPEAIRSLAALLGEPDPVKVRVLEVFSRFGKPAEAAEGAISSLLASTNLYVKAGAVGALWEIVPSRQIELFPEMERLASQEKNLRLLVGLKMVQMQPLTPQAGELLATLVREGNDSFCWSAFGALGRRGIDASNSVPALFAGLEAENPRVAAKAAEALGNVAAPEPSTLRRLEKAEHHEHLMVRDAAREALAKLQSRVER